MQTLPLSIDTELAGCESANFYSGLCLTYFNQVKHFFTPQQKNKIEGDLRRGDLSVCQSAVVTSKLDDAKATGNMSTDDFKRLYQFYSFTRKLPASGDDYSCKLAGYNKLLAGERSCMVTNMTIDSRIREQYPVFDRVKTIIQEILGDIAPTFLSDAEAFFGPGSTVNINNRTFEETSMFYKITDKLVVPEKACKYLAALVSANPNWVNMLASHYALERGENETYLQFEMRVFDAHFLIVSDSYPSKIGFVPKDINEHRAIGIELNGLVPLQKVVGDMIRKRLRRAGIDLNSQQRNRHMASLAKTFMLATIDLANASSSISFELVRALLPPEWFVLIDTFRSSHGRCGSLSGSGTIKYRMVSSMGNGFTFELESLIFFALAKATCQLNGLQSLEIKRSVSIYGDDIIIPKAIVTPFLANLTLFGFTANKSKSFTEGSFFESCGADYYDSTDVRPFFLKRRISTVKDVLFLLNSLMFKVVTQRRNDYIALYTHIFRYLPDNVCMGPLHFEIQGKRGRPSTDDLEATLRVPLQYAQSNGGVKYDYQLFAYEYKKWVFVGVISELSKSPQYAVKHARYMTFLRGNTGGKVILRGRVKPRQIKHVTSRWDGTLTSSELKLVDNLFSHINYESTAASLHSDYKKSGVYAH